MKCAFLKLVMNFYLLFYIFFFREKKYRASKIFNIKVENLRLGSALKYFGLTSKPKPVSANIHVVYTCESVLNILKSLEEF